MPVLKLELDEGSLIRLAEVAVDERRPMNLQAEVLLLQALGRWPLPLTEGENQDRDLFRRALQRKGEYDT
jgi:hypothetical protein